ncbi:unnamed protein product [Sphagnum jensenii]|uniref:Uncharacterized protein n=1 Tax=Sphagnum jensenii TaxID=128206 RepID=A0ABP0W6C5_9BRYO
MEGRTGTWSIDRRERVATSSALAFVPIRECNPSSKHSNRRSSRLQEEEEEEEELCNCKICSKTGLGIDIDKLHKSGVVVNCNATRIQKTREYSCGLMNDIYPHTSVLSFSELQVFKIEGGPKEP